MSKYNYCLVRLNKLGVIRRGHFVYAAGDHGPEYVGKDILYSYPDDTWKFACYIAEEFYYLEPDVVIGPAVGGAILAFEVAKELSMMREVRFGFADKDGQDYVIKRGYEKLIPGKRVLIVEDVLNSGGSVAKVIARVRELGGIVVGVAAVYNRGGVTKKDLGLKKRERFYCLVTHKMVKYPESDCPLCRDNVAINEDFGKGKEFKAKKAAESAR
jgi:orotate phosphoribosyltransferase